MQPDESNAFDALRQEPARKVQRSRPRVQESQGIPTRTSWRDRIPTVNLPATVQHLLFVGGLTAISWGAYMIYRPLGSITAGVIAISLAFLFPDADEPQKKVAQTLKQHP